MLRVIDALEEHDDVQNVYANFDIPDDVLASVYAVRHTSAATARTDRPICIDGGRSDRPRQLTDRKSSVERH